MIDGGKNVPHIKLIDFEDLKFGNKIGVGGYGEVFRGRWNKLDVAIKRIFKKTTGEVRRVLSCSPVMRCRAT